MSIYYVKELRLKINEMIDEKKISPNLCYLCIAHLNEKINYSSHNYKDLIPKRDALAKLLINNGIDKSSIIQNVRTIHQRNESPTLTKVKEVSALVLSNDYTFVEEMIPDEYILRKTPKEIQIDSYRLTRDEQQKNEEKKIQEIIDYIVQTFTCFKIDDINVNKIKELKTNIYSYDLILDTIKVNTRDLTEIMNKEGIEEKGKFAYFVTVIDNNGYISERYKYYKHNEEIEDSHWRYNAYNVYLDEVTLNDKVSELCSYEKYIGKEKFVISKLKKALIELHYNESYRRICHAERNEVEIYNRPKAEYKKKTKNYINPKFEDLW